MNNTISNTDDVIDSRAIIERIEELEEELTEAHEQGEFMSDFDDWIENSRDNSDPIYAAFGEDEGRLIQTSIEELYALRQVAEECEGYGDWEHGEVLIKEDYFTDYIEELIKDCHEMPKDMDSGRWPWNHMKLDYEAAAEEAKVDYMEVDFDGVTYYMRSC